MKKTIWLGAIVIVSLISVGIFKLISNETEKTTAETVAELVGNKYGKPANTVIIEVGTDNGSFAKGTVNYTNQPGGGIWLAAKTPNGWELAHDGNGITPCDVANKYNFPREMIPQCIDIQNGNRLITR